MGRNCFSWIKLFLNIEDRQIPYHRPVWCKRLMQSTLGAEVYYGAKALLSLEETTSFLLQPSLLYSLGKYHTFLQIQVSAYHR